MSYINRLKDKVHTYEQLKKEKSKFKKKIRKEKKKRILWKQKAQTILYKLKIQSSTNIVADIKSKYENLSMLDKIEYEKKNSINEIEKKIQEAKSEHEKLFYMLDKKELLVQLSIEKDRREFLTDTTREKLLQMSEKVAMRDENMQAKFKLLVEKVGLQDLVYKAQETQNQVEHLYGKIKMTIESNNKIHQYQSRGLSNSVSSKMQRVKELQREIKRDPTIELLEQHYSEQKSLLGELSRMNGMIERGESNLNIYSKEVVDLKRALARSKNNLKTYLSLRKRPSIEKWGDYLENHVSWNTNNKWNKQDLGSYLEIYEKQKFRR